MMILVIVVLLVLFMAYCAVGSIPVEILGREDKWGNKTGAIVNCIIVLSWPLLLLYSLTVHPIIEFVKWWRDLPDSE